VFDQSCSTDSKRIKKKWYDAIHLDSDNIDFSSENKMTNPDGLKKLNYNKDFDTDENKGIMIKTAVKTAKNIKH